MARVRIQGNTIVLEDTERREVMGVVDVDGRLWQNEGRQPQSCRPFVCFSKCPPTCLGSLIADRNRLRLAT